MLTGVITLASGLFDRCWWHRSRPPRPTSSSTTSAGLLREQAEGRRGLDLEHGDRLAGVGPLATLQRVRQLVVADEHAAARAAEANSIR